jgi:hypothetical protein
MTTHEAAALLANSAADMVRKLEGVLCQVPPERRSRQQHNVIWMARKFYNTIVETGDIRTDADLERVAEAVGLIMWRRVPEPAADRPDTADNQGGI